MDSSASLMWNADLACKLVAAGCRVSVMSRLFGESTEKIRGKFLNDQACLSALMQTGISITAITQSLHVDSDAVITALENSGICFVKRGWGGRYELPVDQIRIRVMSGDLLVDIAKDLGVSERTIWVRCKENGIKIPAKIKPVREPKNTVASQESDAANEILRLRDNGFSVHEITLKTGRSLGSVYRVLQKSPLHRHARCTTYISRSRFDEKAAAALYSSGLSLHAVSGRLNCPVHWVRAAIFQAGIMRKPLDSFNGGRPHNKKHEKGKMNANGYRIVWINKSDPMWPMTHGGKRPGYIGEHRLVMARHLGRCLKPWEIVHHKDHVRSHNWIENLELVVKPHEHTAETLFHYHAIKRAAEIAGVTPEELSRKVAEDVA